MDMRTTATVTDSDARAYRNLYEQSVTEAAFVWLRRAVAVRQARHTLDDIAQLEQRIALALDALMTSIDLGWECCAQALALGEPGEQFTASVVAWRSQDNRHIQAAVETGLSNARSTAGLISALGWLRPELIGPWIPRFLQGKDMNHKYLGIAACSVRRENPGEALDLILARDDCRRHPLLYTRALRLAGELRRRDLMPAVQTAAGAPEPAVAFWANWSLLLLGQHAAVQNLRSPVFEPGPHRSRAIQTAFRVLPVAPAQEWISALAKDPANARAIIAATGVLGDPQAVRWLIAKMAEPPLARVAAESFTDITGIDLVKHRLHRDPPPARDETDIDVDIERDEHALPWPDADKVAALWHAQGGHFTAGRRYFLGRPITPEWLRQILAEGGMRHRQTAALELALGDPASPFLNTASKVTP